jgi:hypothetical protein
VTTIAVSAKSKTLNELLKKAKRRDLILQSPDGEKFLLSRIKGARSFYVGSSNDFAQEVETTRKNKRLMKFLDERRAVAKTKKGTPLEKVRRELGVE